MFETRLKNNELQKQLFTYISGGIKSPEFLVNKFYKDKNFYTKDKSGKHEKVDPESLQFKCIKK